MESIAAAFNAHFANWSIELPSESIRNRQRGKILQSGWIIWYLFGSDANGEYLDYYACHRMTNDRHARIHADGSVTHLDAMWDMCVVGREGEYRLHNNKVAQMLREKGFRD